VKLEALNSRFGSDRVVFSEGNGGLAKCNIKTEKAELEFYLQGSHITHFKPRGADSVLWMSTQSEFRTGVAIRGGIPICWPWFGPHPTDARMPQHGFARIEKWNVIDVDDLPTGEIQVQMSLSNSPRTRELWPFEFDLSYRILIGEQLKLELICSNVGSVVLSDIGCALHTYFQVADIKDVQVHGLDERRYIDKTDGASTKWQSGPLWITEETDRVFLDSAEAIQLVESRRQRSVNVQKTGSQSTVIWNPWIEKANAMVDFPNDGYQRMICIETANAGNDVRKIGLGGEHILTAEIAIQEN
jgi:glucose-6-phosphate 1-epimerase